MDRILIIVLILAALVIVLQKLKGKAPKDPDDLPYKKRDSLFTPAERSFHGILTQAVGDALLVSGKVNVADVLEPIKGLDRSKRQIALNKINRKHFDFVLCDKADLSVVCVIELNDKSHNAKNRQDRDKFLEKACISAGMPLIQFRAKAGYNINDVKNRLSGYITQADSVDNFSSGSDPTPGWNRVP